MNAPRLTRLQTLTGMLAAPFAWLVQMGVTEALAAQSCFPHDHLLPAPALRGLDVVILAVNLVCLLLGGLGGVVAWCNFTRLRRDRMAARDSADGIEAERRGLDWSLACVGVMSSMLFLFALVATDSAVLIVSPCSRW
jgi:hypothetical protein